MFFNNKKKDKSETETTSNVTIEDNNYLKDDKIFYLTQTNSKVNINDIDTKGAELKPSHIDIEIIAENEEKIKDDEKQGLQKGLSSRHIQLIALGGCIGTGLFVGAGITLNKCGPAGLVISYVIISTMVYPIMTALGEMVCFKPGTGKESTGSVQYLVKSYVDKSLAFATGWNYYYCFVVLIAAECTATTGVIEYWTTAAPKFAWILIVQSIILILNICPVRVYGEAEFWFALTKIICIVGLIILSFIIFLGGGPHHDRLGFRYWKTPGSFSHHLTGGSLGNVLDIWTGIILGAFSFILGPELVVLPSSECVNPRKNIKKASKRFIWRLMFFYILGTLSISVIVAYNSPALSNALQQGKPGAGSSPFVIGIQNAGITIVPHIVNACILLSAWSSGNAYLFASARSLQTLAVSKFAPKCFGKINRWGVPYVALLTSFFLSFISYLNCSSSTSQVFRWFANISTISGFIGWSVICVTYLRFRRIIQHHNLTSRLPYIPWGQPYLIWYSLVSFIVITITNGYEIFFHNNWDVNNFLAAYITLPIFFVLWVGHKICTTKSLRGPWYLKVDEVDIFCYLEEIEVEERYFEETYSEPKTLWGKFIEWLL